MRSEKEYVLQHATVKGKSPNPKKYENSEELVGKPQTGPLLISNNYMFSFDPDQVSRGTRIDTLSASNDDARLSDTEEIPPMHHALLLPEIGGMILANLPTITDIYFATEVCTYFGHVVATNRNIYPRLQKQLPEDFVKIRIILVDILASPDWDSWNKECNKTFDWHDNSPPVRSKESFLSVNCLTAKTADTRDALVSVLEAISPFWRSRRLSEPSTKMIKLLPRQNLHGPAYLPTIYDHRGLTIGNLVDVIVEGLGLITAFPPPDPLEEDVPKLQVVFMGPCILVMVGLAGYSPRLYGEWRRAMRPHLRWG
ncbi:hypothetical protein K490DRAFT_68147 [Saccharata proteae CBS 121410]|uniref:Uncharacterized protein n=1 Tax=Saccharata proteae CBS 121410 TaxID=1314787 RepID=A0A9P4LSW5_9PEZI|nr:hypothetical protein K490DRAFT_68147 [Saccharata proteae CBS 121410]